jgi:hypothetical protein
VLKLHRISPQLAGHSTASRRAKEAGSRVVACVAASDANNERERYASFMPLFLGFPDEQAQTNSRCGARTILPSQRHDFAQAWPMLNRPMRPNRP